MFSCHALKFPVTLLLLAILPALVTGCKRSDQEPKPVTVGAVLPLTGPIAQYGEYMRQGIQLAYEDAVKEGAIDAARVKLAIEDGAADPARSVTAFQKLIATETLVAVIPATSAVTLAMKPIANRKQVVMINASAISTEIEDADDHVFSVLPSAKFEGGFLAEHAVSTNHRQAAVIYRNDPSGVAFRDAFKRRLEELGGKVVFEDAHTPNTTDFRPYLDRLARGPSIDVVFVASFGPEVAAFVRQVAERNMALNVIAYTTFNSPKVLEIAGDAAEGVEFSAPAFDAASNEPIVATLREAVRDRFNQSEVNYYIASHYDAAMLLFRAIGDGSTTGEQIRRHIASLKAFNGISGHIKFIDKGASTIPFRMYTVRNGQFAPLQGDAP